MGLSIGAAIMKVEHKECAVTQHATDVRRPLVGKPVRALSVAVIAITLAWIAATEIRMSVNALRDNRTKHLLLDCADAVKQSAGDFAQVQGRLLEISRLPDAWGQTLDVSTIDGRVEIRSAGSDGQLGTRDDLWVSIHLDSGYVMATSRGG